MKTPPGPSLWGPTLFIAALLAGIFVSPTQAASTPLVAVLTWFVTFVLAEALWHPGSRNGAPVRFAPAAQIVAVVSLSPLLALGVIPGATAVGDLVWRRHGVLAALRLGGQSVVGVAAALLVLRVLAPAGFYERALDAQPLAAAARHVGVLALGALLLLLVHQGFAAGGISRRDGVPLVGAWRDAFGNESALLASVAMIAVALLAHGCHEALGYRGVILCVMPALFVHDGSRRYVELERAQEQILRNERLAAKGEMAAEIGHELNNYLAAIVGRAQLLTRTGRQAPAGMIEGLKGLEETGKRMAELARGLVDFAHRGAGGHGHAVNDVVERTVNFVRPQPRFRGVRFDILPGADLPAVDVDPGLIQQALLRVFSRVIARAPAGGGGPLPLAIRTFSRERPKTVGIEIQSGPLAAGDADATLENDPDLVGVQRILARHQGRFETARGDAGEETYRLLLPAA